MEKGKRKGAVQVEYTLGVLFPSCSGIGPYSRSPRFLDSDWSSRGEGCVCVDSRHPPSFHERRRITTPRPTSAIHVAKSGGSGTRSPSVCGNKEKDGGREVPNPNVRIESEAGGETSEERKPKVGRERGRNTPWTATERASR